MQQKERFTIQRSARKSFVKKMGSAMKANEALLNNLFHDFLLGLDAASLKELLNQLFKLPGELLNSSGGKPAVRSFLPIPSGEIDEFISFGKNLGIAIELKTGWKTSPGQLKQYFEFASSNFSSPFLILITRNTSDTKNRWLEPLFHHKFWVHVTWSSLYQYVQSRKPAISTIEAEALCRCLEQTGLIEEKKIRPNDFGLNKNLPPFLDIDRQWLSIVPIPKNVALGCWKSGQEFWDESIGSIFAQTEKRNFYCYRWDFYHYLWRWAFHEKEVFFDMRKDNKWEYYQDYYEAVMERNMSSVQNVKMSTWYKSYLQIGENQMIELSDFFVGVVKVEGKDCYFVLSKSVSKSVRLEYVKLWESTQ